MYNRVAKVTRYNCGPGKNDYALVFGEIRPGGGRFRDHTNQLLITLDGQEVHKYWNVRGLNSTLRYNGEGR